MGEASGLGIVCPYFPALFPHNHVLSANPACPGLKAKTKETEKTPPFHDSMFPMPKNKLEAGEAQPPSTVSGQ